MAGGRCFSTRRTRENTESTEKRQLISSSWGRRPLFLTPLGVLCVLCVLGALCAFSWSVSVFSGPSVFSQPAFVREVPRASWARDRPRARPRSPADDRGPRAHERRRPARP